MARDKSLQNVLSWGRDNIKDLNHPLPLSKDGKNLRTTLGQEFQQDVICLLSDIVLELKLSNRHLEFLSEGDFSLEDLLDDVMIEKGE